MFREMHTVFFPSLNPGGLQYGIISIFIDSLLIGHLATTINASSARYESSIHDEKRLFKEHFFSEGSENFSGLFSESESATPYCFESSEIITETEGLYNKYMK